MASLTDDPRLTGDYVRRVQGEVSTGAVTLVGVVHDHPASEHRVRTVLDAADPAVLALELPPLAVPLYEEYADGERTPPAFGGEMSTAIQAATADRVVGIDGPSAGFVARLLRTLSVDAPSPRTAWSVLRSLPSVTKRALVCRLGSVLADRADLRLEVGSPTSHGCDRADGPQAQATDEQSQIDRARRLSRAFEQSSGARIRTVARNQHMASRIDSLRRHGRTVAVVGIAHLDPLAYRLAE